LGNRADDERDRRLRHRGGDRAGDRLRGRLLRAALVVIGGIMLAGAAIGALAGWRLAAVLPLAFWGVILAGGVLIERRRYRLLTDQRPGRDWQPPTNASSTPRAAGWSRCSSTRRRASG